MAAPALGDDTLEVTLTAAGPVADARTVSISGRGRWSGRADDVAHALSAAASRVVP